MTVSSLLANISSKELTEWIEFYKLEPFGEERDDLRSGIVASTIANVNRKKKGKAFEPRDFMPQFEKARKEPQSWQDQLAWVEMLNAAYQGKDLRAEKDKGTP